MTDRKTKEAEWLATHTLNKEQFKQLIQNKMKRVMQYHRASDKRESRPNAR